MLRDAVARGLAEIVGAENVRADVDVPRWPRGLGSWPTGRSEDTAPRPISLRPACELGDTGGSAPGVGLRAGKGYGPTADLPSGVLRGGRADAVVRPRTAEEVRAVVALAGDEGLAVTVRGGGTGLWGGAVPARGGIVVSTEYLAGEPEIHRDDLYVVAGAGTLTGPLRARLADAGLLYPVDPASEAGCTLGGNVGEGACGLRSLKYGTTRNYVLGLELVTAEAKLVTVGARTVKNVAGYDLTRLMVGSEGTLAIATSVVLKVLPLPPDEVVTLYAFPDAMRAAEAAVEINALGFAPVLLEMMDRESLGGLGWAGDDLWKDAGAFLLVAS